VIIKIQNQNTKAYHPKEKEDKKKKN